MGIQILNKQFDYSLEPHRAILFEDVKSNYASIEWVLLRSLKIKRALSELQIS